LERGGECKSDYKDCFRSQKDRDKDKEKEREKKREKEKELDTCKAWVAQLVFNDALKDASNYMKEDQSSKLRKNYRNFCNQFFIYLM
jgi:hypothetical protein